jgi:hypothetical protein
MREETEIRPSGRKGRGGIALTEGLDGERTELEEVGDDGEEAELTGAGEEDDEVEDSGDVLERPRLIPRARRERKLQRFDWWRRRGERRPESSAMARIKRRKSVEEKPSPFPWRRGKRGGVRRCWTRR